MKKTMILAAMVAGGMMTAQAATLGQWSFPDQGLGGSTANAMGGTGAANVTAGNIAIGSGYDQTAVVEDPNNLGTYSSYIDATGRIRSDFGNQFVSATGVDPVSHGMIGTQDEYWGIGDWADGTTGGGRSQISSLAINPRNTGPAATGALTLNSSAGLINDVGEAVQNNLFFTVDVTANGADLTLEDFSFYATRGSNNPVRSWQQWTLEVDTGLGYSLLGTSVQGSINTDGTWGLETMDFTDITLADGSTATFRVAGKSTNTSGYGRPIAIDDIQINGIPEPATLGMVAMVGGAMLFIRRKIRM